MTTDTQTAAITAREEELRRIYKDEPERAERIIADEQKFRDGVIAEKAKKEKRKQVEIKLPGESFKEYQIRVVKWEIEELQKEIDTATQQENEEKSLNYKMKKILNSLKEWESV